MTSPLPDAEVVPRLLAGRVSEALSDTRVVAVVGPRQAGKSTLARNLTALHGGEYVTLDDPVIRDTAQNDPSGFVANRSGLLTIDEIQRVPDLVLAIKALVDRDERPGRLLITGSSQLSANRGVADTLAGRVERLTLWPFSQDEIAQHQSGFLDRIFARTLPLEYETRLTKADYLSRATTGGFPEALRRASRRRSAWFSSYVTTVIEREAPGITASPRTAELPRLLRLVSARHAALLNIAGLAADAQLARSTLDRYLDVLESVFLTVRIPAWSPNVSQREIRAPKIFIADSGLAAHLRGFHDPSAGGRPAPGGAEGPLLEGMAALEIIRQSSWAEREIRLSHYRDREGAEVDLVVEVGDQVSAIEIKSSSTADRTAIRNLARLRDALGDRFACGVILTSGTSAVRLSDRIVALPMAALWEL